ncbi:MAG: polyprenyl synthetase family protein [Thermodesulfobacteriota bacterium]|nr:polyprenyl synthetase family protein [Thermodesulfobacteriota bacterium]
MNEEFERRLKELTRSSTPLTSEIGDYILDSGGKRFRPMLVTFIGEAIGLLPEDVMPIAFTVELLHTASLLHDDVVDGTKMRRSRPTANQVFGDKQALLAGDYIFGSALELTGRLGDMRVVSRMMRVVSQMAEGELKELEYARAFHARKDVYEDIIYLKTATLFEFCTCTPGILAGLDDKRLDALETYGRSVGMCFQVVDDIINLAPFEGDNKDAYNDIAEGKSTLPLIRLFEKNPGILREVSALSDPMEKKDMVISHITRDILEDCVNTAQSYCDDAVSSLETAGLLTARLRDIPHTIMAQMDGRF